MNHKEVLEKWVEALRSGKYEQAEGSLRARSVIDEETGDLDESKWGYCCLGVLADLVDPEGWGQPGTYVDFETGEEYLVKETFNHRCQNEEPEMPSAHWFTEVTGLDYGVAKRLAGRNDSGDSFLEIADAIEVEGEVILTEQDDSR